MRDGIRLSAWLYVPAKGGQWPVVFEQRYAELTGTGTRRSAADIARAGFAVALVNFRGTHESEGRYVGYRALAWGEQKDGYDVCEWLAAQPWSTGKIGTFGSSQGGYAQNFLAVTRPPHLACQYMVDTGLSLFQEGYRIGGVTRPARHGANRVNCRDPADNAALLREWDAHPDYDDYWRAEDCTLHFAEMDVPCFTIGSWYDFMVQGSVQSFIGRQLQGGTKSRGRQQLLLGPWLHGRLNKSNKVGELVFPPNAVWPELAHMTRWFNYWLKGEDNGVMRDPPVRYYLMGAVGESGAPGNVWREAQNWPPAAVQSRLYLHEAGKLAPETPAGAESRTSFVSDPQHPMEMPGRAFPGAKDARAFEAQKEVRTWTTDVLAAPVEWTGEVKAEVWLSSTARDTDLILRVSDVYPDGRSMLVMDYPFRARYREGFDRQVLLTPGQPALLAWHIGWTSLIFNQGHRIRVTISSTGAPLYEPNNQTGGAQTMDWMKESRTAENAIWHDAGHRSCVVVPVMPGR
ncbi:MAG: CocE/NonD family hydrolase [Verrucomicrobia bacterium]|nr:CocE/NonD family hydrolase [Verrucomicrobiota bacterium]